VLSENILTRLGDRCFELNIVAEKIDEAARIGMEKLERQRIIAYVLFGEYTLLLFIHCPRIRNVPGNRYIDEWEVAK
jgi:hypothetical protein